MNTIITWRLISRSLDQGIPVMLLYVLESRGSSPGRQGFFMAVNARGEMEGSIGGGIMEHKFIELARERLKKREDNGQEIRKQYHDKAVAKDQSGMICSGEQTILLYAVKSTDTSAIQNIIVSLEQNKNGSLLLFPSGINFTGSVPVKDFHFAMRSASDWEYVEKTGYKNHLFIVGGGHCALALSRLMRSMDFYIRVFDERKDLKTLVENDFANEKIVINDYTELGELIPAGINHYVVIMTLGYRTDDIALRSLLGKQFGYLGMLGSAQKVREIFDQYRKEGMAEKLLQELRAPIGLSIKSQTPDEIAVSIAAEIIQIKNQSYE